MPLRSRCRSQRCLKTLPSVVAARRRNSTSQNLATMLSSIALQPFNAFHSLHFTPMFRDPSSLLKTTNQDISIARNSILQALLEAFHLTWGVWPPKLLQNVLTGCNVSAYSHTANIRNSDREQEKEDSQIQGGDSSSRQDMSLVATSASRSSSYFLCDAVKGYVYNKPTVLNLELELIAWAK
ncbi:hypothetical protein E4U15_006049 [Claviceps sp. LM218 group G6]|nr:hypothetical protein E4U15_006049 [Claviceps sp. LM218 group G6]